MVPCCKFSFRDGNRVMTYSWVDSIETNQNIDAFDGSSKVAFFYALTNIGENSVEVSIEWFCNCSIVKRIASWLCVNGGNFNRSKFVLSSTSWNAGWTEPYSTFKFDLRASLQLTSIRPIKNACCGAINDLLYLVRLRLCNVTSVVVTTDPPRNEIQQIASSERSRDRSEAHNL